MNEIKSQCYFISLYVSNAAQSVINFYYPLFDSATSVRNDCNCFIINFTVFLICHVSKKPSAFFKTICTLSNQSQNFSYFLFFQFLEILEILAQIK